MTVSSRLLSWLRPNASAPSAPGAVPRLAAPSPAATPGVPAWLNDTWRPTAPSAPANPQALDAIQQQLIAIRADLDKLVASQGAVSPATPPKPAPAPSAPAPVATSKPAPAAPPSPAPSAPPAPAAPAASATPGSGPMLQQGLTGDPVKTLQQRLNDLGFSAGTVDGIFGPNTEAAVKAFQTKQGITVDGIVGPQTWGKLGVSVPANAPLQGGSGPEVQNGSSGDAVKALQTRLNTLGFNSGTVDGIFGPNTEAAVKAFQTSQGITVDGIVGPQTWNRLGVVVATGSAGGTSWAAGNGQLQGADTSSWQSDGTFQQSLDGAQFSVIKASEGTGFTDPTFQSRWNELGQKVQSGQMQLRMAYCFLDSGNGTAQADHFLDVVGIHGPVPAGTRLVLDWEADALNSPQTLKDAADRIHDVTGTWPIIYVQGSKMSVAQSTVPGAPIWEANWGSPTAHTDVPFLQFSDGPGFDHDVFNGDTAALRKFAGF